MNFRVTNLQTLEQAQGVRQLFLQVYGEEYPIPLYYQPEALLADQGTVCAVALNDEEEVVGHVALYHSAPSQTIQELGAGVVRKDARSSGILGTLCHHLIEDAKKRSLQLIFAESVCNHIYSQKAEAALGFLTSALELNLMPAEAYIKEESSEGRVSATLSFLAVNDPRATVYLPKRYMPSLQKLYEGLHLSREFQESPKSDMPEKTLFEESFIEMAGLTRIVVKKLGLDFEQCLHTRGELTQLFLKLQLDNLDFAVEQARQAGFFFGGLLPRWTGVDCLVLQKPKQDVDWDSIKLYTERAKEALSMVKTDSEGALS